MGDVANSGAGVAEAPAAASSYSTNFDDFTPITFSGGSPMFGGSEGWSGNGVSGLSGGTQLDVELVDDGSGGQALRISNAVTSGNYDTTWPFAPAVDAAGENETNNVFSFSVDFKSATTDAQPGASIDITPGLRGTAVRQGLLRVVDNGATGGLSVGYFETVENGSGGSVFQFVELANNLDRSVFRPFADSCGKTAWQGTGMSSVER